MRHALPRLACALVAVACVCLDPPAALAQGGVIVAGTLGAQETDLTPEQEERLLAEYWAIAKRYRTPDFAKAIAEMSAWTRDRIGKVQSIQYQPEGARPDYLEGHAEWKPETLRGAAMLHTEIALQAFARRDMISFEFQTGIADGWFALADNRESAPGSLRARWNVTIARLLLAGGDPVLADRHLARINERIPNDPQIILAYGTVKETLVQRQLAQSSAMRFEDPTVAVPLRDTALNAAVALLTRAAGSGLPEARLRLAHVYVLKHDDARAEPLLKEALSGTPAPAIKYLANLFMGGLRERQRQLDAAARLYVEAIVAVPDGQSAYLALAHILYAGGQRTEAATVLDRLFNRRIASVAADPWWIYAAGLDIAIESRLDELRAEVRK